MKTIHLTIFCGLLGLGSVAAQSITAAEYFLNADPGPGNGTSIPLSTSSSVDLAVEIPASTIAALPEGVHSLVCRVMDAEGDWSIAFSRPFYKVDELPSTTPAPVTAAEYFINSDPGPGNGTAIPLTPSVSPGFAVDVPSATIAALSDGIHTLVCRVMDADGDWSIAFARPFHKDSPVDESNRFLARIEYQWFQSGVSIGTPQSINAPVGQTAASWLPELPLPPAAEGDTFQLVVAAFDSYGNQSHSATRLVTVSPPPTLAEWAVTAPEALRPPEARLPGDPFNTLQKYFFGTDPAEPSTGQEVQLVRSSAPAFASSSAPFNGLAMMTLAESTDSPIGLKFRRSRYIQGVSGTVEASSTLEEGSWVPVASSEQITPVDAYTDEVTLFAPQPDPGVSKQFLRLKVLFLENR